MQPRPPSAVVRKGRGPQTPTFEKQVVFDAASKSEDRWIPRRPASASLCTAAHRLYSSRNRRAEGPLLNTPRSKPLGISSPASLEVGLDPLTNGKLSALAAYKKKHTSQTSHKRMGSISSSPRCSAGSPSSRRDIICGSALESVPPPPCATNLAMIEASAAAEVDMEGALTLVCQLTLPLVCQQPQPKPISEIELSSGQTREGAPTKLTVHFFNVHDDAWDTVHVDGISVGARNSTNELGQAPHQQHPVILETATTYKTNFDARIARLAWEPQITLTGPQESGLMRINQRVRLALTGSVPAPSAGTPRPQSANSLRARRQTTTDARIVSYQKGVRNAMPDVFAFQSLRSKMVFSSPSGTVSPSSKYHIAEAGNPLNAAHYTRNPEMKRSLLAEATDYITGRSHQFKTPYLADAVDCGLARLLRDRRCCWSACGNPFSLSSQLKATTRTENSAKALPSSTNYNIHDLKGRDDLAAEVAAYSVFIHFAQRFNDSLDPQVRRGRVLLSSLPRTWETSSEDAGSGALTTRRLIAHSDAVGILDVKNMCQPSQDLGIHEGKLLSYSIRIDSPPLPLFQQTANVTTLTSLRKILCGGCAVRSPQTANSLARHDVPSQLERGKCELIQAFQRLELFDAFAHFTLEKSGSALVVEILSFCEDEAATPIAIAVHTNSSMLDASGNRPFGRFNGGRRRIVEIIREHICNDMCKSLKLSPMIIH